MASYIGSVGVFDRSSEDWPTYVERTEQFMMANKVGNDNRVSTLLSLMGSSLLRNLVAPKKPPELTYDEIVKTLTDHLAPRPLVIAERFRFHRRNQTPGENITSYMASLQKLARYCDFGPQLDDALGDQLVCGLSSSAIQKRLLSEAKLDCKKAVEIAIAMEAAAKDTLEISQQAHLPAEGGDNVEVHRTDEKQSIRRSRGLKCCYRCGNPNHLAPACWHRDKKNVHRAKRKAT